MTSTCKDSNSSFSRYIWCAGSMSADVSVRPVSYRGLRLTLLSQFAVTFGMLYHLTCRFSPLFEGIALKRKHENFSREDPELRGAFQAVRLHTYFMGFPDPVWRYLTSTKSQVRQISMHSIENNIISLVLQVRQACSQGTEADRGKHRSF